MVTITKKPGNARLTPIRNRAEHVERALPAQSAALPANDRTLIASSDFDHFNGAALIALGHRSTSWDEKSSVRGGL